MKNIMPWVKANIAIVVLSAVILLILPAAFVGSNMWNSKIRKNREKAVSTAWQTLESAKVSYSLPPAAPGAISTPFNWPAPNPVATEFFRVNRAKIEEQVKRVTVEAEAINKAGHTALIDGVFPNPTSSVKTLEFCDVLVGKGGKPSAYQLLLDGIKAGGPADPSKVAEVLRETNTQAIERNKAKNNTEKLTPEDQKALDEQLSAVRIGQYMAHAKEISVYATKDVLPANILKGVPPEPPAVTDCWKWQEDYWVISDMLAAVGAANKIGGTLKGVDESVVKRILGMAIAPLESSGSPITGRKNSAANKSYDIRTAVIKVIVSSARLPQYINAISRTDFMTVTNIEFAEVDRFRDLDSGFYYGDEHVVEATFTIETIWLRSWTTALMPEAEKNNREKVAEEATPPPAPVARAPRPSAEEEAKPKGKAKGTKRPKDKT